jgi:hypothetical protein
MNFEIYIVPLIYFLRVGQELKIKLFFRTSLLQTLLLIVY